MRIIFLDIDGVILPVGAMSGNQFRDMIRDPYGYIEDAVALVPKWTVEHLNTLAQQANAQFVLISSWRGLFAPAHLETFLRALGLFDRCHVDWEAPMQGMHTPRPWKARDMAEWLGDHPGCEALIIDDDELDLGALALELPQIKPISNVGFSRDDLARALKHWCVGEDLNLSAADPSIS